MRKNMTDVLLLGAGFSKAISSHMPLLEELSAELKDKIEEYNVPGDNVEHWMTYLSQTHPWLSESENLKNRALFLDVTQNIKDIISRQTETTIREATECPSWLRNFMQFCVDRKLNIITLNYDTLLESAAQLAVVEKDNRGNVETFQLDDIYPVPMTPGNKRRASIFLPYGEEVDSLKLFKLHGSVNWFYSGVLTSTGETIYYSGVKKWTSKRVSISENEVEKFLSDKVPLIVPPTIEKASFFQHETIRAIWWLAGQAIQSAKRLVCIGYSLPEADLSFRFFLERNAPSNQIPLYFVNRKQETSERYKRLLGKFYNVDDKYNGREVDERLMSELFPKT